MFKKVLIANRGEIACRVMRTARAMGLRSVAVFSDADAGAPHVSVADEAVRIGPAAARDSYLNAEAILDAARRSGADALHPGYGFLSEHAGFAQACLDAGLVFIGPPPAAMRAMGGKAEAKRRMVDAGVPTVPGYFGADQSDERLIAEAKGLGLPLLVKAVAGGGGRGMRLVRSFDELPQALASARRESESAFGDGTLMLERLIEQGRHIEIQVFADSHGNCVHLGERDCTAQRRRQKVIEESPSPVVSAAMRESMGRDAVAAALAVGYVGAGTVEFIVDAEMRHYFLEMNTRLQVEHPVTELVTGFDLVEWQLRVAAGEPLPVAQHQIQMRGHAIEARLYAEDPYNHFAPQTGRIGHWRPEAALRAAGVGAASGLGTGALRIDHGIAEGQAVTPHYDAMVAKLIVHGSNRDDAIRRLVVALEDTPLLGLKHNGRYLADLLRHDAFRGAQMHTALLDEWAAAGEPINQAPAPDDNTWFIAAAALALRQGSAARPASVASFDLTLRSGDTQRVFRATVSPRSTSLRHAGREAVVSGFSWADHRLELTLDGVHQGCTAWWDGAAVHLARHGAAFVFSEPSPYPDATRSDDPTRACSPVAGIIAQLLVQVGDKVVAGQQLASVEAMKMEMWLTAKVSGTVIATHRKSKEPVSAGELIVEIESARLCSDNE